MAFLHFQPQLLFLGRHKLKAAREASFLHHERGGYHTNLLEDLNTGSWCGLHHCELLHPRSLVLKLPNFSDDDRTITAGGWSGYDPILVDSPDLAERPALTA